MCDEFSGENVKSRGQNLKKMFLIMLSHSVVKLTLEIIELIYLCPGHLRNRNAHSVIKNASKTKFIRTTIQLETTIKLIKFQNILMPFKTNVKRSSLEGKIGLRGHQVSKLSLRFNN